MKKLVAIVALMALAACTNPVSPFPDHDPDSGSVANHDPDSGSVVANHDPDSGS